MRIRSSLVSRIAYFAAIAVACSNAVSGCAHRQAGSENQEIKALAIDRERERSLPSATSLIRRHRKARIVDARAARKAKLPQSMEIVLSLARLAPSSVEQSPTTAESLGRCSIVVAQSDIAFRFRCEKPVFPWAEVGGTDEAVWMEDHEGEFRLLDEESVVEVGAWVAFFLPTDRPVAYYRRHHPDRETVCRVKQSGKWYWVVHLDGEGETEHVEMFDDQTGLRVETRQPWDIGEGRSVPLQIRVIKYQTVLGRLHPEKLMFISEPLLMLLWADIEYRLDAEDLEPIEVPPAVRELLE